jgi:hypothetical protein
MRRRALIAGMGIAGAGVAVLAGAGLWRVGLFQRYAPTRYDDLLNQLHARDAAARLGREAKDMPALPELAAELRSHIGSGTLREAVAGDITAERMHEVAGWIVPLTVAQMASLAARA